MDKIKLGKSQLSQTYVNFDGVPGASYMRTVPGLYSSTSNKFNYKETIKLCRWFYTNDSIAGTVVNRMADMSVTTLRNRRKSRLNKDSVDDVTMSYFDALAKRLRPILKLIALEFMIHGMAVPAYTIEKVRGDILSEKLGRKRYYIPDNIWVRNPEYLDIKRRPIGYNRQVFAIIPEDDVNFILNKGMRSDGSNDPTGYEELVRTAPEFVKQVANGQRKFLIEDARPIFRKLNSFEDFPFPFLTNALQPLQHKAYIKSMDKSIVTKATEAIRHFTTGDKDYPADDDDINSLEKTVLKNSSTGERIFNLFTNHTVKIGWIFPPMDALLDENKYAEPNADIFLALGFPRILTVGETLRSNASDSKIAVTGPKATLDDLRDEIIQWLTGLYQEFAELNGFTRIPEPYWSPIATSDYTALVQFAIQAMTAGAISKDDVAQLWGTDYETVADQLETEYERGVPSPAEKTIQDQQQFQMDLQDKQNEQQQQQNNQQQQDTQQTTQQTTQQ